MNRAAAGLPNLAGSLLLIALFLSGCAGTALQSGGGGGPDPSPGAIIVSVVPATATVQAGQTQSLTATVANDSAGKGVTWAVSGAGCGGAACGTLSAVNSASGTPITYTAPATAPSSAVTLTATSVADATKSASATITINAPPAGIVVTVAPATVSVPVNGTSTLTATLQNDTANKGVTWTLLGASCSENNCGSIAPTSSGSGAPVTYTAPASVPTPVAITARATSVADSTKSASATITITPASTGNVSVSLTPKRGGLTLGQALNFTATVTNDTGGLGVTWSVAGGGSFTTQAATTATFVAPATAGVVTVTATSKADVTKSASATIGVSDLAGVLTYHNNLARDGTNKQEFALTTANVTSSTFGKLFSCSVDAAIYAQPLWVPGISIGGGKHNIVVIATMRDSVYVFDAEANPCVTYWHKQLIPAVETYGDYNDVISTDIVPDIGILGTPVIDPASNTVYVVTKTKNTGTASYHQRIHALSLVDGSEKFSGPVDITSAITVPGTGDGSSGGNVPFDTKNENQRCGLALVNGIVYVAWASHGDYGPYHGWVIGYNAGNLGQTPVLFNTTPNGTEGGIWMSGGAPAADAANNLYVISGNGTFDKNTPRTNYSMAFMKLSTSGGLNVTDFFTPMNEDTLSTSDVDFGSGGAAVLIDANSGPFPHLVIGGGKDHQLFVLNRDGMGGYSSLSNNVVQTIDFGNAIFATAAFWNNNLYLAGTGLLKAYTLNPTTSQFSATSVTRTSLSFGFPGATPSISSSGTTNGIVWAIDSHAYCTDQSKACGPAVLHAYDATDLGTELWNSGTTAGNAVKFTVPTVANGKVYIGTCGSGTTGGGAGELDVYGLLPN